MKTKACKRCQISKPIEVFVTAEGFDNPRGKYCVDCWHEMALDGIAALMGGRSSCLYCGREIAVPPSGKPLWHELERDHMDPKSRGGWDHPDNIVWCCKTCNQRKRNILYADWLKMIEPELRKQARQEYVNWHCYQPEDFVPLDLEITISIGLGKQDQAQVRELEYGCEWYNFSDDENNPGGWERWYAACPIPN